MNGLGELEDREQLIMKSGAEFTFWGQPYVLCDRDLGNALSEQTSHPGQAREERVESHYGLLP